MLNLETFRPELDSALFKMLALTRMQQSTSTMTFSFGSLERLASIHWRRSPQFQRSGIITAIAVLCLSSYAPSAFAQKTVSPDEFPPNPLELKIPDPLLPQTQTGDRSLTTQEQQTLSTALDELNTQATKQFQSGQLEAAFETWYRELRLRRVLGLLEEVAALSRVGTIAWEENRTTDVRQITERLQAIQQQAPSSGDVTLLRSLGQAYQQLRAKDLAVTVYEQILSAVRQQQDLTAEAATLDTIGQLHVNWFSYTKAAATYQQLLTLVRNRGSLPGATPERTLSEISLLQQLAHIYQQGKQPEPAIAVQQELINLYQTQDPTQVPRVRLAIADNYQALGQRPQAIENYQAAYLLAQPLQQFAHASEALKRLGTLYRAQNELEAALRIYTFLVDVEAQSYNVYGRMNAYDTIGQIHIARQEYPQAVTAFQQGLTLAQQLNYQQAHFTQQIEQATQAQSRKAP
jgi:tetratricopeptide (TPR) repeat protein